MTLSLAVHHPIDPALPVFDFWAWRVQRRLAADRILALAAAEEDAHPEIADELRVIGRNFGRERVSIDDAEWLRSYIAAYSTSSATTMRDVVIALSEIVASRRVQLSSHWAPPALVPDWDRIPFARPAFVGTANGVPVHGRLVPSTRLAPDYSMQWVRRDGALSSVVHMDSTTIGEHLNLAPGVWDWLVARRLTLICLNGQMEWPVASAPPVALDSATLKLFGAL